MIDLLIKWLICLFIHLFIQLFLNNLVFPQKHVQKLFLKSL